MDVCSQQNYSQTHAFTSATHVWRRREEGCRRLLSGRCEADDDLRINIFGVRQTEDCYSARHSRGSRLKEQPGPRAWCVSLCVCVWVHRTNRDTCRLTLPDADKTAKRMCGASSTYRCQEEPQEEPSHPFHDCLSWLSSTTLSPPANLRFF